MKTTCEIMVQRVLPAIRAEIARVLIAECRRTQQEAADLLGLSRAAVSQYLNEKRGAEVCLSEDAQREIRTFTSQLLQGLSPQDQVTGMCTICKYVQMSGWLNKNEPDAGYCVLCNVTEKSDQ